MDPFGTATREFLFIVVLEVAVCVFVFVLCVGFSFSFIIFDVLSLFHVFGYFWHL